MYSYDGLYALINWSSIGDDVSGVVPYIVSVRSIDDYTIKGYVRHERWRVIVIYVIIVMPVAYYQTTGGSSSEILFRHAGSSVERNDINGEERLLRI